jgi:predicted amidophosphoribosyltransferase
VFEMSAAEQAAPQPHNLLEEFLRAYLETAGGDWEEVEPQVYDVLLPPPAGEAQRGEGSVVRLTFDPEALPEHRAAQLASFGTPLVDGMLADALRRGRTARFYLAGLNLAAPRDLEARVRRTIHVPAGLTLELERVRPRHFPQAVFWFQAEFASDQKEQDFVSVAMDLHYGREVRQMEPLLDPSRLVVQPPSELPDARHAGLRSAYLKAREQALRSVAALANLRNRELTARCQRQTARMRQYYADLRHELQEQARRSTQVEEHDARLAQRRAAIDREEAVRIAELRRQTALRVHLRLLQVLVVRQAKLLARVRITKSKGPPIPLDCVFDPLLETIEAPSCPRCARPSYSLEVDRLLGLVCPACVKQPSYLRNL